MQTPHGLKVSTLQNGGRGEERERGRKSNSFDSINLELSGFRAPAAQVSTPGFDHSGYQLTSFLSYHQTCLYVRLRQVQEDGGRGRGEGGRGRGEGVLYCITS